MLLNLLLTEFVFLLFKIFEISGNFYRTFQFMNTEEDNSRQGRMNTPTLEGELVVELNSDILKTIDSLQLEL